MDILEFLKFVPQYKVYEIYTEHWVSKLNTYNLSPGVSNVVIEQLPDEVQPELGRKKRVSKTSKRLLLEWNVGNSGVDELPSGVTQDDGKEPLHTDELPTVVAQDDGKEPLVEDEFSIGIDKSMLDDFDPFWGEGDNVDGNGSDDEGSDNDELDLDFEVELHNVVDEVAVDMDPFLANTDLDMEWISKKDITTEIPNVDGDADAMYMDGIESNTDDEDL